MSLVIALINQKGGVGKTTSTVNLAYALKKLGQKVLVLDLDPQASLTDYYGFDSVDLDEANKTLHASLVDDVPLEQLILAGNAERPDLIPSGISLAHAEANIISSWTASSLLRNKLEAIRDNYDFILIDCPPTLTILTVNALSATDTVLIPVKTDRMSARGITLLLPTIQKAQEQVNPQLKVLGVLPTMYNPSYTHDQKYLQMMQDYLEPEVKVFEPIHRSTAFDKAVDENKATLELAPNTASVGRYMDLANYIIQNYQPVTS